MTPPNILFITVDCLRADVLAPFGGPPVGDPAPAPTMSALAAAGARLSAFAHSSFTKTTFPSLFSGTYPGDHGGADRFGPDRPSLPAALRALGYVTIGVNSNPWLSSRFGYERGFTSYVDRSEAHPMAHRLPMRLAHHVLSLLGAALVAPVYPSAGEMTAAALAALATAPSPWFLWIHYMDAHWPYAVDRTRFLAPWHPERKAYGAGLAQRSRRRPERVQPEERDALYRAYLAGIAAVDRGLGPLLDAAGPDAVVLLTADHGEAFGEHGRFFHEPALHAENLRVPLLLRGPGIPRGAAPAGAARHIDVAPTLVDFAGGRIDGARGVSLLPALQNGAPLPDLPAFATIGVREGRWLSLRQEDHAILVLLDHEGQVRQEHLYDLAHDPAESYDLAREQPERTARLRAALLAHAAVERADPLERVTAVVEEPADRDLRQRLRALGYLDEEAP